MDPVTSIQLRSIEKNFRVGDTSTPVLRKIDFDAFFGEVLFLVGPSGSGKTTLLSVLCGTLRIDAGEINILGNPLHTMSERAVTRFRAKHIGFIFQQFNLIPTLTIEENVAVPLLIQGMNRDRALTQAREIVARVGLEEKLRERPSRLSGGQQQRVAIARALIHSPDILVCDEPTSALDSRSGHQVMDLIREVARDKNRTVIVVTHDYRIYGYADRLAEMEDGRIGRVLNTPLTIAEAHPSN